MARVREYNEAMKVIHEKNGLFKLDSAVCCMDRDCYFINHYGDSGEIASSAHKGMQYLCDDKTEFLETARRLIVKFAPGEGVGSFQTFLCLAKELLRKIQKEWTQQKEDELNKILKAFSDELEGNRTKIDALRPAEQCTLIKNNSEILKKRAAPILSNSRQCLTSMCGYWWTGQGNPAGPVIKSCESLEKETPQLYVALQTMEGYVREVSGGVDATSNTLKKLKNSDPAKKPDWALQQLDEVEGQWKAIIAILE